MHVCVKVCVIVCVCVCVVFVCVYMQPEPVERFINSGGHTMRRLLDGEVSFPPACPSNQQLCVLHHDSLCCSYSFEY